MARKSIQVSAVKLFTVIFVFAMLFSVFSVFASVAEYARDITKESSPISEGFYNPSVVFDGSYRDYTNAYSGATLSASNEAGIGYIYFIFESVPPIFTVTDTKSGEVRSVDAQNMIHVAVDLTEKFGYAPTSIRISLDFPIAVSEIYLFSEGKLPDWVQVWSPALNESDLLLLVSHSDDDQLFFAGLLPLYAGERNLKVQVAYFTNHDDAANRRHELLDGLWHTGVRYYPIIAEFPDLYSESYEGALSVYAGRGYEKDDFTDFVYKLINSTRPLVVVSHDINGEYGHGTHILCTSALIEAANKLTLPESYGEIEGKWFPAKIYLHLYSENELTLDIDSPLSAFSGKTAFEISQEAFGFHLSQHWTWFYNWIYGKSGSPITASHQIATYNPAKYGLYSSAVGFDTEHNDFFENLETLEQRAARLEAEKAAYESESVSIAEAEREKLTEPVTEPATEVHTDPQSSPVTDKTEQSTPNDTSKALAVLVMAAALVCVAILLIIQFKRR